MKERRLDDGTPLAALVYLPSETTVEARPNRLEVGSGRPRLMVQAHCHAHLEINYVVSGNISYRFADRDLTLSAGQIGLFWGGTAHQLLAASREAHYICLHLPPADFLRLRPGSPLRTRMVSGSMAVIAANDPSDAWNFERWFSSIRYGVPAIVEIAVDEVLLRLERSQFGRVDSLETAPFADSTRDILNATGQLHVVCICDYVGSNFREAIEARNIAAASNLNPTYAMTLFKKGTGMTLNDYVGLLRLGYAQALLVANEHNIIDIAMASGFGSLSAFNKSFSKRAGTSPSRFRREAHDRLGRFRPV